MASGFCGKLVKFVLILCNGLLALFGLCMFIVALLVKYNDGTRAYVSEKFNEYQEDLFADMNAFITIGFTMFVICTAGFVGSALENMLALKLYTLMLALLFSAQMFYIGIVISMKERIRKRVYDDIATYVINYDLHSDRMRMYFDDMQSSGYCCGCKGPNDYKKLRMPIPESCPEYTKLGCCYVMWKSVEYIGIMFGIMGLCVLITEYVAIWFTYTMITQLEKTRYMMKSKKFRRLLDVEDRDTPKLKAFRTRKSQ